MDEPMSKARLLDLLRTRRAEFDAVVADVPEDRLTESGATGHWSVKDVIAHLSYHEGWYADRLHEQLRGEAYTPTELDWMPFDERNDIIYRRNKDRSLADIQAESKAVFDRLIAGVEAHPESFLLEPQPVPGAPEPIVIWQMLRGDVYDHYPQHITPIRDWLAAPQN